MNAGQFLQEIIDHVNDAQLSPVKDMKTLTAFEALLILHVVSGVKSDSKGKTCKMKLAYTEGTLIRLCVQLIMKAWKVVFHQREIASLPTAIGPHMGWHGIQPRLLLFSKSRSSIYHIQIEPVSASGGRHFEGIGASRCKEAYDL